MDIAFIIDPIDSLNITKDSSVAMMRAAQNRNHKVTVIHATNLRYQNGKVLALSHQINLQEKKDTWYQIENSATKELDSFDLILVRKDPPVDVEYFYLTYLLDIAEKQGARVVNSPSSVRSQNEKLGITDYPEFITPTLVSRHAPDIKQFLRFYGEIILKPLDGMGGTSIFKVTKSDPNINVIIETITRNEKCTIMAQKFISEITLGDKRVLLIDGKPIPFSLARIPKIGEVRGNLAAGGKGVAMPLTTRELEIASSIGPKLAAKGLFIVGLDIIGDFLTEVNVTSPTCMQEIADQTECNVAEIVIQSIEAKYNDK